MRIIYLPTCCWHHLPYHLFPLHYLLPLRHLFPLHNLMPHYPFPLHLIKLLLSPRVYCAHVKYLKLLYLIFSYIILCVFFSYLSYSCIVISMVLIASSNISFLYLIISLSYHSQNNLYYLEWYWFLSTFLTSSLSIKYLSLFCLYLSLQNSRIFLPPIYC